MIILHWFQLAQEIIYSQCLKWRAEICILYHIEFFKNTIECFPYLKLCFKKSTCTIWKNSNIISSL